MRAAIVRSCPDCFSRCKRFRVSISPVVRPTLLRQIDMGSLTCAQMWVCAVDTKWGGRGSSTNKTRRDRTTVPHSAPSGHRTQGLRIWINSNALTTEQRPPSKARLSVPIRIGYRRTPHPPVLGGQRRKISQDGGPDVDFLYRHRAVRTTRVKAVVRWTDSHRLFWTTE